jgi:hypothetical protein
MPIEKILIEFAKLQLQVIAANEHIIALQAQIAEAQLTQKPEEQKS